MGTIGRIIHNIVWFLSGEFFLRTRWHRAANGGTVILLRTLFVSVVLYIPALLLNILLDYFITRQCNIMGNSLAVAKASLPWFGAIFAAVYAALYTRFSSQWTYMAGLYNQIKATEAQTAASANKDAVDGVFASWKAGFIEDADDLHLALKPMFAAAIRAWSQDEKVQSEFATHTFNGQERLEDLLSDVERVLLKHAKDSERKALTESKDSPSMPPSVAS